jgi:hypothetical protein
MAGRNKGVAPRTQAYVQGYTWSKAVKDRMRSQTHTTLQHLVKGAAAARELTTLNKNHRVRLQPNAINYYT